MNENYILLEKDIEGNLFEIGQANSLEELEVIKNNAIKDREDVILTVAKIIEVIKL